jgi:predicted small lipoprotein YifL
MKKWKIVVLAALFLTLLTGCGDKGELYYQGKVRTVSEVEEMLADYLESENPNQDFLVDIVFD